MLAGDDTADGRDERLDQVVVEYLRARSAGAPVDRQAYLSRHPDLADDLGRFFADEDEVERLAAPLRALAESATSGRPSRTPAGRRPGGRPLPAPWGAYELLEEIGRGGMGVVYRARDVRLGRVVAVKVLAPGASGGERFDTEARAAARLQHPNVVQIFEVGEYEGQPYLVLEYVAGGSLAERLKGRPVAAPEAARLVMVLAGAVEEAHRCGVVHRDLKPANILLTAPGPAPARPAGNADDTPAGSGSGAAAPRVGLPSAKIADFGLAKQLDGDGAHTETGAVLGTPSYMAPEQAEGRRGVGPPADVYALGAILYELLTGRPPFRGVTRLDTLRQVVRDDPVPPRRLQPGVPRDLETVCLKCLEKDPARRYPGAGALAEDVGRFLAGEPVRARRVGAAGRAWRWCRRQPVLAGLAAALALALAVGVPLLAWQWARAEEHSRVADQLRAEAVGHAAEVEESFRLAHQVLHDFTSRLVESRHSSAVGQEKVRKELLEKARNYYLRFLERQGQDPALRFDLALTYLRLASVTQEVASPDEALGIYRQAEGLFEEVCQAQPENREPRQRLAGLRIELGGLFVRLGRHQEAIETLEDAQRLLEGLLRDRPGDLELEARLAGAHNNLGIALADSHRFEAGLRFFERSLEIYTRLAAAHPKSRAVEIDLAGGQNNVGYLLTEHGRPADGLGHLQEAASARERLARRQPGDPALRFAWAESLNNLGICLRLLRRFPESLDSLAQARKVLEELVAASPDMTRYRAMMARVYFNVGMTHFGAGEPKEALPAFDEARNRFRDLARQHPSVPEYRSEHARVCELAGGACVKLRRLDVALRASYEGREVLAGLVRDFPANADYANRLGTICNKIAAILGDLHRPDEARAMLGEAIARQGEAMAKAPGEDRYRRALAGHYALLARIQRDSGRTEESVRTAARRVELSPRDPDELYGAACDFAHAAAKATDQRDAYAGRAVVTLRQAVASGFRDRGRAEKERAFEGLRAREDFQDALGRMGPPAAPTSEAFAP